MPSDQTKVTVPTTQELATAEERTKLREMQLALETTANNTFNYMGGISIVNSFLAPLWNWVNTGSQRNSCSPEETCEIWPFILNHPSRNILLALSAISLAETSVYLLSEITLKKHANLLEALKTNHLDKTLTSKNAQTQIAILVGYMRALKKNVWPVTRLAIILDLALFLYFIPVQGDLNAIIASGSLALWSALRITKNYLFAPKQDANILGYLNRSTQNVLDRKFVWKDFSTALRSTSTTSSSGSENLNFFVLKKPNEPDFLFFAPIIGNLLEQAGFQIIVADSKNLFITQPNNKFTPEQASHFEKQLLLCVAQQKRLLESSDRLLQVFNSKKSHFKLQKKYLYNIKTNETIAHIEFMFLATASEEIKQIVYDEIKSVPGLSIVSKTENSFTAEITDRVNEKIWHQQTSLLFKRINDLQKKGTNEKQRAADFHAFTPDSKQPTSTLFVPPKTKVKTRPHTPPPAWYFGDDTLNQDPEPETPRYVTLKFANGTTLRVKTTYLNRLKNKDGFETGITVFFNPKAGDIAKCRVSNPTEYDNAKKCALRATTCGPVNKKGMKFIGSSFWEVKLPGHDARVSGSEETVTCIHDDGMQEKISIIHLNQYTRSAHA